MQPVVRKRRLVGRKFNFTDVKDGSATVVDAETGVKLGRVVAYQTASGLRWTAMLRMGSRHEPIGRRRSRREAAQLVSQASRR